MQLRLVSHRIITAGFLATALCCLSPGLSRAAQVQSESLLSTAPAQVPPLPVREAPLAAEQAALRGWIDGALLGRPRPQPFMPGSTPGLSVERQDYGSLHLRQSVMSTPLRIGKQAYEHGLGTHVVSEIRVRLPEGSQQFNAQVGIDNNYDTQGKRGSAIFVVEVAGQEVYRSGVRRGGDEPVPVQLDLKGARELTLRVLDDGDGPDFDQSDWADASVSVNGRRLYLDELPLLSGEAGFGPQVPFSFLLDGKASAELLSHWQRTQTDLPAASGRERHIITYRDAATGLEVRCEATLFANYPAVEWVLTISNTGTTDSPLLEQIRPLDLRVKAPADSIMFRHSYGSANAATDFLPLDEALPPNGQINLAPNGGRSSDGSLPFFNLDWGSGGLVGAVGWSGQWALHCGRNGGQELTLQTGQQTTHFKLHPGESIRTPRILLVSWQGGERMRGHNLLRRLLLEQYTPRQQGLLQVPPITQNTWFTYNSGNDVTEANQLQEIAAMAPLGVEAYWLDAGWFEGGWPSGVGSWVPRADAFPHGLKPLGDAAHARGMKFVVWFEPERVSPGSRIAKEHPQWVLHAGDGDGLFNLGDPAARQWLADLLSRCIEEWGIDIYRNDFNIDPLRFWQADDAANAPKGDRQGMAEIRYIEGFYALWDELLRRHPGLIIDDCASGGRRIDLETLTRSLPLWRSDTPTGGKAMPVWDQAQTAGLSLYVPLHASGLWQFDPYIARSVATMGTDLSMNSLTPEFKTAAAQSQAQRALQEIKTLRPLYLGDYYPLLDINLDEHHWCGWQFHRADLNRGFVMCFRRSQSPYEQVDVDLHGLEPNALYEVTFVDSGRKQTFSGVALSHQFGLSINAAPGSILLTYRKVGGA